MAINFTSEAKQKMLEGALGFRNQDGRVFLGYDGIKFQSEKDGIVTVTFLKAGVPMCAMSSDTPLITGDTLTISGISGETEVNIAR